MPAPRPPRRPRLPAGVRRVREGYYQARLMVRGERLTKGGADPEALGRWYAEQRRRVRWGTFDPQEQDRAAEPLKDYLGRWLVGIHTPQIGERHWQNHERHANLHLVPALGQLPLGAVRAEGIRTLYAQLQAPPRRLSLKTVREIHSTLRLALRQAVVDRILDRNEADLVTFPRQSRPRTRRVLTSEELARFWEVAADHRLYALWLLASLFPSRSGELRALQWSDLDERAGVLHVRRSLERSSVRAPTLKAPKTEAGTRDLQLDAELLALLRAHRTRQKAERLKAGRRWVTGDWVFTTSVGTPLDDTSVRVQFRRVLKRAGLPDALRVRFHDLRHTAVSALLAAGVPLPEVSAVAGHSNPGTTARLYAAEVRRVGRNAMTVVAAFHRQNVPPATGDSNEP